METVQKQRTTSEENDRIVRILSKDIKGSMKLYPGLAKIKGISWSFSNAICQVMGLDRNRRIGSLTEKEVEKIIAFIKNPQVPKFVLNRRFDYDTGEDKHLVGSDLELRKEFDIKRLKKIKSYRGFRHMAGLPSRGQRTRSHFRTNKKKGVGIKKKTKQ